MAEYNYLKYNPYIYVGDKNKKYRAIIKKDDGTYINVRPIIYTKIDIAIADIAIAGISIAG